MMRDLKVKLNYKDGEQIIKLPGSYVNRGCTHFFNAQHLHLQLTPEERCYYEFLCEKMDLNNRVEIKPQLRNNFIIHFKKLTSQKPPEARTLNDFENKLRKLKLLLKIKNHGKLHFVNPKYVSKGTQAQRRKAFELLADYALFDEIDITAIIDRPLDKLLAEARMER